MPRRRSTTSTLYKLARLSNTLSAARRGPASLAKRQVRKRVYRRTNRGLAGFLKRIGLG